jgi:REP element-mobilizing transposase RayT
MARSRYVITDPDQPHFLTCTVMEWLPVFSRPETVGILLDSWRFLREQHGLRLYGYVVLDTHTHFIAQAERLDICLVNFKSFTAKQIIHHLEKQQAEYLLTRLRFSKRAHKSDREFQFWQEGSHAEMVLSDAMMREKLEYIHANPVKRGYVDEPEQWRYSSARNYAGENGLVEIDRWW